jgi:hypothetical protein
MGANSMKLIQNLTFFATVLCITAIGAFASDSTDPFNSSGSNDLHQPMHDDSEFMDNFVPDSQRFWDNSKNWTTNYGPAYRDTVEKASNFLPCTGRYALCFSSGPEPLPCELERGGRFATCKCTIETGLQFVTISSILNYDVYLQTISVCGVDGSKCATEIDKAPVCRYLRKGRLIPGAEVFSDFSPQAKTAHTNALNSGPSASDVTHCSRAPYAGCMTAPCQIKGRYAECSCPVFWGPFQLMKANAQCQLNDGLIWSASYLPSLDTNL